MGSKLGLDGARIKELRIQRGWTQEQFAEISGVSARTIQRVETTDCASFETARGIAIAFETDFERLLKSPAAACDPEPAVSRLQAPEPPAYGEVRDRANVPPATPARRFRVSLPIAAAMAAAGLLAGAMLAVRFDPAPTRRSSGPLQNPQGPAQTRSVPPDRSAAFPPQATAPRASLDSASGSAVPVSGDGSLQERAMHSQPPLLSEMIVPAQLSPRLPVPLLPQPAGIDTLLRSRDVLGPDPADLPDWLIVSNSPPQGEEGVVRQAVGQTGKTIGNVFSAIGSSVKRIF